VAVVEPAAIAGSAHLKSDEHKDVRWFSFYDHAVAWDCRWHCETLCHAFSFWCEGKSPWHLKNDEGDQEQFSESYSTRVFVWNVTLARLKF